MDTFTATGYAKATDVVTFNATVGGVAYTGLTVSGVPKDTVANVKAFFKAYMDAYVAGLASEAAKQVNFSAEAAALLNVATSFT